MKEQKMQLSELKRNIRELAILPEQSSPMISCYLNLSESGWREYYKSKTNLIKKALSESQKIDQVKATKQIEHYLQEKLLEESKGVALFCRIEGEDCYLKAMQFQVPVSNWVTVDNLPNIYPLVELKDSYHRYVTCPKLTSKILTLSKFEITIT